MKWRTPQQWAWEERWSLCFPAENEGITWDVDKHLTETSILGQIVKASSERPDSERLKAPKECPVPDSLKELRRLIGFFRIMRNGSSKAQAKVNRSYNFKSKVFFRWVPSSFLSQCIKLQIADACSTLPTANVGRLLLKTDASGYAIGSSLSQNGRPIEFFANIIAV